MSFKDTAGVWCGHTLTHCKNRQLVIFSNLVESTPILLVWVEAVEVEAHC